MPNCLFSFPFSLITSMSNTKELAIILKNPDKCYYPGDLIHGKLNSNKILYRKSIKMWS